MAQSLGMNAQERYRFGRAIERYKDEQAEGQRSLTVSRAELIEIGKAMLEGRRGE